jgi:hypothetical protein
MALVVRDRVKQFSVTAGTGTLTLGATPNGFQSFSTIGDGNTTYYTIVNGNTGDFEVGIGTYALSGDTLSRDTVLSSSNSGNLVDFNADSKEVFVVYPAERAVFTDVVQTLTNKTINGASNTITNVSLTTGVTGTLPIGNGGTGQTTAGAALNALLPSQTSQAGKFLTTSGTDPSWSFVPDPIPSGTKMLFQQTTAPTGWTKDTTHDNKALRVVSGTAGSGGSVAFTTAFASQAVSGTIGNTTATNNAVTATNQATTAGGTIGNTTATNIAVTATNNAVTATNQATTAAGTVGATTLTINQIPSHTHTGTFYSSVRSNGSSIVSDVNNEITSPRPLNNIAGTRNNIANAGGSGSHNHGFTGTSHNHTQDAHNHTQNSHNHTQNAHNHAFTGTSHNHTQDAHNHTQNAHNHTFTGTAINLAVQYVDLIIATKD